MRDSSMSESMALRRSGGRLWKKEALSMDSPDSREAVLRRARSSLSCWRTLRREEREGENQLF